MRIKDDEVLRKLGLEIRSRRKALRMSQEKLADGAGVTFKQVSRIERGLANPSTTTLVRIALALKGTPDDLLNIGASAEKMHDPRILSEKLFELLKGKPKLQMEFIRRLADEAARHAK
jgi:transcriptional regulator with XRE-family HTH domain